MTENQVKAFKSKARRDRRRELGQCLNHDGEPATCGVLCAPCRETHRKSS